MKLATGHPFDAEHRTGANRTAQPGSDFGMSCCDPVRKAEPGQREHNAAPAAGENAEVADAAPRPWDRTWVRNRRRNSSEETFMFFCLLRSRMIEFRFTEKTMRTSWAGATSVARWQTPKSA